MKELKIKIFEWKDIAKWFWDKFCFPRRKLVAYRDNTCDVVFPEERKPGYGSNYTPPKKKRRK